MKIGLSYSRCVRDIIDGTVDIGDVLIIIARTDFDPHNDEQWANIWNGYRMRSGWSNPEWGDYEASDEAKFRSTTIELYNTGRMHQPRQFGAYASRRAEIWLEAVLPSSELDRNPAAKDAWDQFQMVAGLTNVTLDKDYQ